MFFIRWLFNSSGKSLEHERVYSEVSIAEMMMKMLSTWKKETFALTNIDAPIAKYH